MVILSSKLYKRLGLLTSAFILSISGLIMAAPLYFSQMAHADTPAGSVFIDANINGIYDSVDSLFSKIQDAIIHANPGDTIHVMAGTYNEALVIDRPLSLIGDTGDSTIAGPGVGAPILDGTGLGDASAFTVNDNIDDVTIKGFEVKNYDFEGVNLSSNANNKNIMVSHSYFHSIGSAGIEFGYGTGYQDNITIDYNKLSDIGNSTDGGKYWGIRLTNAKNTTITNNKITMSDAYNNIGIEFGAWSEAGAGYHLTNNTISNNTINNTISGNPIDMFNYGIDILTENNPDGLANSITGMTVSGNNFNLSSGNIQALHLMSIGAGSQISDVSISGNTFTMNGDESIYVEPVADGIIKDIHINNNSFVGSYNKGIISSVAIDATNNWWGDASGPKDIKTLPGTPNYNNPLGSGAAVSSYVNYKPWFTDAGMKTLNTLTAAPAKPTNLSPSNGAAVNGGPTQSWDAVVGADHYEYESFSDVERTQPVYPAKGDVPVKVYGTSRSVGGTQNITIYWRVRAVNTQGVAGEWSDTNELVIDNTYPTTLKAVFSTNHGSNVSINGINYTNSSDFTFNLSSSDDAVRYQLKYWNNFNSVKWNPTDLHLGGHSSTLGVYTDSFTQGEGTHYFSFSACDAAGNCSAYSDPFVVTYDKTVPVVAITAPFNGDIVKGIVTVSGTVKDTNPDHYYMVVKNSKGTVVAGPGTVYQAVVKDWNWDTTSLSDGTYTIDLEARDAANNKGVDSTKTIAVIVDNTAPVVAITSPTTYKFSDSATVAIEGTTDDAAGYNLFINGELTDSGTSFSGYKWNTTGLSSGDYLVRLEATDLVGNVGDGEITIAYTAPAPVVPTPLRATITPTASTSAAASTATTPGVTAADTNGEVLGDNTVTPSSSTSATDETKAEVKGATDTKDDTTWSILGLAWYWWLLIVAAVGLIVWGIASSVARRQD